MKITDIRFGMLRVPLKTPFKTALRTVDTIEDIIVTVHTDSGHVGYGEAPATAVITGDTHGSIIEAIKKFISPRLIGEDIANLNRITQLIQGALEKNSSAKAAVEIAVYDLFGQLYDAPLYKMLGGGDPVITTDITISVDYIDKMVADSIAAVDRGFESLKIKVGKDIGVDIERIKAIYAAVEGPRAVATGRESGLDGEASGVCAADTGGCRRATRVGRAASQGAGPRRHEVRHRARAHADHGGRKRVRSDRSHRADSHARRRHHQHQADEDRRHLECHSYLPTSPRCTQIECMIGCMLETSISVAAAVHLAVAKSNVITKVDLDGPSLCPFNPVDRRRDLQRVGDHRDRGTRPRHPRDPRPGSTGSCA